jgi:hypothetical protein
MRFTSRILLAIALATGILGQANGATYNYFRHIEINDTRYIKASYQIDSTEANSINCYKMTFDDSGRLSEIAFQKRGMVAPCPDKPYSRLFIAYGGDLEIWHYTNSDNAPSFADTNIFAQIYEMDNNGNPKTLTNLGDSGEAVEDSAGRAKYILTCDLNGRVVKSLRQNGSGDTIVDGDGLYEVRYAYDSMGELIEIANFGRDGKLKNSAVGEALTKIGYDSLGNEFQRSYFDEHSRLVISNYSKAAVIKKEFDRDGNIVSVSHFGPDGKYARQDELDYPKAEYS